jgi:hypothetical protein
MKRHLLGVSCAVVVTASTLSCAARPARAAVRSSGAEMRVDIADSGRRPTSIAFAVPDSGCTDLKASANDARYEFKVCREDHGNSAGTFDFDIRSTDQDRDVRVAVRVRLARGAREVLADLHRTDGSTTDISVRLD